VPGLATQVERSSVVIAIGGAAVRVNTTDADFLQMLEGRYAGFLSARIAARQLGEEMLVMSGQGSTLFTLNPTATVLWQAADGATPLNEIVERRICSEFEVQPEEAMRDAEVLAEDLAEHGILLISEEPIARPDAPVEGQPPQERQK
jgi:hypothetical protein